MSAGLYPIGKDIWEVARAFRAGGMSIGGRMTVVKLADGGLWLHSPVKIDDDLTRELDTLGPVAHIVAPNKVHHLMVGGWAARYPDAVLHGAPGLAKKRADLVFRGVLGDEAPDVWKNELQQVFLEGAPIVHETVFLHPKSSTLIVTDLVFNVGRADDFWTKLTLGGLLGATGGVRMSRTIKFSVRDRAAFKKSVDRVLERDFQQISVTHGEVVRNDAKDALRKAAAWVSHSQ
jgi:hypothetical protein